VRLKSRGGGTKVVLFKAWVGGGRRILIDVVLVTAEVGRLHRLSRT
jgi:hypothetical protein